MDRSYLLNSYVKENEENLKKVEESETHLQRLQFRIKGSKSIDEIKKEVSTFLFQNNVPTEIEEGLTKICDQFSNTTTLYQAETRLEDFLKKYLDDKEDDYKKSNETVDEIKKELLDKTIKKLDEVGITLTGDEDAFLDKIQSEDDVYKLNSNIDNVVDYYEDRRILEEDTQPIQVTIEEVNEGMDKPGEEAVLETTIETEQDMNQTANIDYVINNDQDMVIDGNIDNKDSMNFTLMMANYMAISNENIENPLDFDMKFIKTNDNLDKFKVFCGDLGKEKPESNMAFSLQKIAESYDPNIDYFRLLEKSSPALATSFNIIINHILNNEGSFQMAIKRDQNNCSMIFAMDEHFSSLTTAFEESGALVSHDSMENSIIKLPNNNPLEQNFILTTTFENIQHTQNQQLNPELQLQNQYQKKLVYPDKMNEAANVNSIFLNVVAFAEVILLILLLYFIFS